MMQSAKPNSKYCMELRGFVEKECLINFSSSYRYIHYVQSDSRLTLLLTFTTL